MKRILQMRKIEIGKIDTGERERERERRERERERERMKKREVKDDEK